MVEVDGNLGISLVAEAEVVEDLLDLQWIELRERGTGPHGSVDEGEEGEGYQGDDQEDVGALGKRDLRKEKKVDNGMEMRETRWSTLGRQD